MSSSPSRSLFLSTAQVLQQEDIQSTADGERDMDMTGWREREYQVPASLAQPGRISASKVTAAASSSLQLNKKG